MGSNCDLSHSVNLSFRICMVRTVRSSSQVVMITWHSGQTQCLSSNWFSQNGGSLSVQVNFTGFY